MGNKGILKLHFLKRYILLLLDNTNYLFVFFNGKHIEYQLKYLNWSVFNIS